MKFCENCGTQLLDDATFCEECGTKQEISKNSTTQNSVNTATEIANNNVTAQVESMMPKLSETCTPAKREIRGWLMALLLVMCSPLVLVNLIAFLPEFLFWVVFVGAQLTVLALMWKKCNWHLWIKLGVIIAFVLMYII